MDDRHFDDLARQVGEHVRLPRRGAMRFLGGAGLAAALGLTGLPEIGEARRKRGKNKKNKKCKQEGKKCQRNKDCCDDLKCKDGRCGGSSGRCGTNVSSNTRWGSFGSGNSQFRDPMGVAVDRYGEVYVADTGNSRIQVFDQNGGYLRKWGSRGNSVDRFQDPRAIGVNQESGSGSSGMRAFVSDPNQSQQSHRLRKFRATNGDDLESLGRNGLGDPRGIAIDANNNVWVVDGSSGRVFLFDRGGNYRFDWQPSGSGSLSSAEGIGVYKDNDGSTYVYITSRGNNRILKFEYTGNSSNGLSFVNSAGSQGGGSSSFSSPMGLAVDKCGNIWVADRTNNRIQQLDKNLKFRSRFTAGFDRPTDVALSPNGKFLYVADSSNEQIQKFNLNR